MVEFVLSLELFEFGIFLFMEITLIEVWTL